MKKILSLLLAAVLTVCSFSFVSAENGSDIHVCTLGQSIAGFNTTDLDGNPVTDDVLQNADVTVINFWATWCGPCRAELPYFGDVADDYDATPEADVQIIGVISEGNGCNPASAKAMLEQNGCNYLNLRADSVLKAVFSTSGYIPQTIVVDRTGTVRDHLVGGFPLKADLQEFIQMWYDTIVTHADDMATITYVCGPTGETIGTAEVPYGSVVPEDTPTPPEVTGHTFLKWEYSGEIYESGSEDLPIFYLAMGDVTATATYKAAKYKVKFYDGVTDKILKMQYVEHGKAATAPEHPEHEGYEFTGWDTDFSCVTENLNVHGICVPTGTFTVTWVNYDDSVLETDTNVAYGSMPEYNGETPVKPADAELTYHFIGWEPEIAPVTEDTTYKAIFQGEHRCYTIIWKNYDGSILETDNEVLYGDMPSYDGETPVKPATAEHTYTFAGWEPELAPVEGDATYTAKFTEDSNTYTVTWKNYDGSVLETDANVPCGTMPEYNGETPVKPATAQYTYTFEDWDPELAPVESDVTYTAVFTETLNSYTVTWVNEDGTVLEKDENVPFGTMPVYDGATPEKAATAQYTYTFAGWDPDVAPVEGAVTYTAMFTETLNTYTVTWKNYDGSVLETDTDVPFGTMPVYDGATPEKAATEQYSYTFEGWDPELAPIESDVIYTAKFTETVNTYTVTFYLNDGSEEVFTAIEAAYGSFLTAPDPAPEREGYTFAGWYKEDKETPWNFETDTVTGDTNIYAKWECTRLLGDYDCDGDVDIQDAILTLRAAMGLITPSEQSLLNADIDGSGKLEVTDAILILRKAMGL